MGFICDMCAIYSHVAFSTSGQITGTRQTETEENLKGSLHVILHCFIVCNLAYFGIYKDPTILILKECCVVLS